MQTNGNHILEVDSVVTRFGESVIHNGVTFGIDAGAIVSLIGGSGCGKSVLLREIIGLLEPTDGVIRLFGTDVWNAGVDELRELRRRVGVLFQNGALFSSLTVGENIAAPLHEQTDLPDDLIKDIVQLKLALAGLPPATARKMPSELSGGMRKRVALARALALEPELLFLDEPTSGLDPISARAFDDLVQTLSRSLGLTVVMVTHDLDTILTISDIVVVLGEGRVIANGSVEEVIKVNHPWIENYFSSRKAS